MGRANGIVGEGAGIQLPVARVKVCTSRSGRAPGFVGVGAEARLLVGWAYKGRGRINRRTQVPSGTEMLEYVRRHKLYRVLLKL